MCTLFTWQIAQDNISNSIRNQHFRVLIGDTLSDVHSQENGIVQGAILSVNLFLIALRSITPCIDPSVKIIGYANEWTIYLVHSNMAVIQTADNLENWSKQNGFRFSQTKTVMMIHFCRLRSGRNPNVDPKISLKCHDIKTLDSQKILGLIFDKRLSTTQRPKL
jgi:hypothetical protein